MNKKSIKIFICIGLLISLWILIKFINIQPRMFVFEEYLGYYFLPSLPIIFFIFLAIRTNKVSDDDQKESKVFIQKDIITHNKNSYDNKFKYENKNDKNKKYKSDGINKDIKIKLKEVENLFLKKLISSEERKKMRNKILGI